MAQYRIVRDNYLGYEAQVWRWYCPFWIQLGFCNTHSSVERAEEFIRNRGRVVKYVK